MMIRYASYFIAALLPLLLFRWFAPASIGEIDFWLLWLLAMVLVSLPVVYAEIALAYRSVDAPLAGMQSLLAKQMPAQYGVVLVGLPRWSLL